MNNNQENQHRLGELIYLMLDGDLKEDQFTELEDMLANNPAAQEYYDEFIDISVWMYHHGNPSQSYSPQPIRAGEVKDNHKDIFQEIVNKDLHDSSISKAIEESKANEQQELELRRKEAQARRKKPTSKDVLNATIRIAAVLIFSISIVWLDRVLTERFRQTKPIVVATLVEETDAKWDETQFTMTPGDEIDNVPLKLLEGFAKIKLLDGAEIVLQAPCGLELETSSRVFLDYGNFCAYVPESAVGFVVRTNGATVVDYGTEFGIIAEKSGKTETHVFQGEIELRTGSDVVRHGDSRRLTAGFAGVVDNFGNLTVNKTKKNINRFVRKISAKSMFGCPGKRLDLADIVGGGNGFGTGIKGQAISPETGQFVSENIAGEKTPTGRFVSVEESAFVDGVFIPGCVNGRVQVSSTGQVFNGCGDTDDTSWGDITNIDKLIVYNDGLRQCLPYLDNLKYGTATHPAIYIHTNAGITFDLNAIRSALPGQKVVGFSALCGINETIPEEAEADIRVLVDGKERFGRFGQTPQSAAVSVWLELDKNDRFLTLMVTEGKDGTERDLCLFADAMLELAMVK